MTTPTLFERLQDKAIDATCTITDHLFGPLCRYGCGQRVYVKRDRARHEHLDHAGDELP